MEQLAGASVADARLAVTEAAALHGSSWGAPQLHGTAWLEPGVWRFLAESLDQAQGPFSDRYGPRLVAEDLEVIGQLAKEAARWVETLDEVRCLWHGDYRVDNMLFGADQVTIVDWQSVMAGPNMTDIAYFLGTSLPVDDRRAAEEELVRHYHGELSERVADAPDWNRTWLEYRAQSLIGLVLTVPVSIGVQQTSRGDEMFATMATRCATQIRDLEAFDAVGGP